MAGMEIDIAFRGLQEAQNRLREMEKSTAAIARNVGGAGGGGAGGGGGTAGPMARATSAQGALTKALAGGDTSAIFDARVRAASAQRSLERAQRMLQGTTTGQRLMTALTTSRFGAGGLEPLVGRTAAALGGEAMAGPLALAGAAIAGFTAMMNGATQSVGEFRKAATLSGGTSGDIARAGALGIAPGQVAGAAEALRNRLTTDPRAIMFAQARLGIGPQVPRGFGGDPINEAKLLTLTLERLRLYGKEHGALLQLQLARELGLEGYLDEIRVSDRVAAHRKADAAAMERIYSPETQQRFRDMAAETSRLGTAFDSLKTVIGDQFAPVIEDLAGGLATAFQKLADAAKFGEDQPGSPGYGFRKMREAMEKQQGGPEDATRKNTDAINENTRIMKQGTSGGGPLARGALPAELRGEALAAALAGKRLQLGVFGN